MNAVLPVQRWVVHRISSIAVGRQLGFVEAATRNRAEELARAAYGREILVTIAGGNPRRRNDLARDLGDVTRDTRRRA